MKLGVALPFIDVAVGSDPAAICEFAQTAEEIGRRVVRPIGRAGDYKGHGGAKFHVDFPLGTVAQPVSTLQVSAPGEI